MEVVFLGSVSITLKKKQQQKTAIAKTKQKTSFYLLRKFERLELVLLNSVVFTQK